MAADIPEPKSLALIREALAFRLNNTGCPNEKCAADRLSFACNPSAIAEVLQHVAALSAQVREMEASRSAMEILANFAHRTAIGAIDRADLENEGRLALAQANDCFPRPPPPDAALSAAARGET